MQFLAQERPESKAKTKARALTDEECSNLIAAVRPGLRDFVASWRSPGCECRRPSACAGRT